MYCLKIDKVLRFRPLIIKKDLLLVYIFLFFGAFNDVIRIGTTKITLFRILLPFVFFTVLLKCDLNRKLFILTCVLGVILLLQSVIFCDVNKIGVRFIVDRFIEYMFYYFCIFVVICSVIMIYKYLNYNNYDFEEEFAKFLIFIGVLYLLIFILLYHFPSIRDYIYLNNQNDYGAMLTAILPIYYYRMKKNRNCIYIFLIGMTLLYLLKNDCKMALLGAIIQIFLIIYLELKDKYISLKNFVMIPVVVLFVGFIYFANSRNISINGYNWQDTIMKPIRAITTLEMYPQSNTSISFRVNTFIVGIIWLKKTFFLGVGIGNSGILIKNILGNHNLYDSWMGNVAVSVHNVFLEVLLDFGIIAIIGFVLLIRENISLIKKNKLKGYEKAFIVLSVSSLLWLQGPSGVLVDYLIVMIFVYYILLLKKGVVIV